MKTFDTEKCTILKIKFTRKQYWNASKTKFKIETIRGPRKIITNKARVFLYKRLAENLARKQRKIAPAAGRVCLARDNKPIDGTHRREPRKSETEIKRRSPRGAEAARNVTLYYPWPYAHTADACNSIRSEPRRVQGSKVLTTVGPSNLHDPPHAGSIS